jgi:galactokinase
MKSVSVELIKKSKRRATMSAAFQDIYGFTPEFGVRAPGRVDLMGSHTDYNDGLVLTLPINREIWVLARPRDDGRVNMASLNMDTRFSFDVNATKLTVETEWGHYVQGVALELQGAGYPLIGCDALVHGTVPLASGLSSSAALEAASATLFEALGGFSLDGVEKARLTQRAENRWVGVNCGILDQYSSILGEQHRALLLDCRNLKHIYASLPREVRVVVCNTRAPRQLSGSEYGSRRAQCEQGAAYFKSLDPKVTALRDVSLEAFEKHEANLPDVVARRTRFVIEENARVLAMAEALERNDREAIAKLCLASFEGARDLFEISVPAMQAMMNAMGTAPGVVGCRQAGAGFGGCMVAVVEKRQVKEFCIATATDYEAATGIKPEIYPIRTAPGAGTLKKIPL